MPVEDLRIKHRPPTECEDFETFIINKYEGRRTEGLHRIDECDLYIDDSSYGQIRVSTCFDDLSAKRGIGIVIKKDRERVMRFLTTHDWSQHTYLSANGANKLFGSDIVRTYKEHKDG